MANSITASVCFAVKVLELTMPKRVMLDRPGASPPPNFFDPYLADRAPLASASSDSIICEGFAELNTCSWSVSREWRKSRKTRENRKVADKSKTGRVSSMGHINAVATKITHRSLCITEKSDQRTRLRHDRLTRSVRKAVTHPRFWPRSSGALLVGEFSRSVLIGTEHQHGTLVKSVRSVPMLFTDEDLAMMAGSGLVRTLAATYAYGTRGPVGTRLGWVGGLHAIFPKHQRERRTRPRQPE
jgi:hypothetical protein